MPSATQHDHFKQNLSIHAKWMNKNVVSTNLLSLRKINISASAKWFMLIISIKVSIIELHALVHSLVHVRPWREGKPARAPHR